MLKPTDKKKDLGPPLKILVADDTTVNFTLATKLLKRQGHDITSAENGLQAFETFKEASFDVVLMDNHMPVMDGLESTAKIREFEVSQPSRPPTPIIAMTANNERSDHETYLNSGINGNHHQASEYQNSCFTNPRNHCRLFRLIFLRTENRFFLIKNIHRNLTPFPVITDRRIQNLFIKLASGG